jgi:hypothetical protein
MNQGLAPCEAILRQQSPLPAEWYEGSWEVGRLVLAPEYRSGAEALKRCLLLTFMYLVRTTNIRNGFAVCNPVLGRLYRRFGFSVLASNAWEDPMGSFCLIHGSVPAVLRALTGIGTEPSAVKGQAAIGPQPAMGQE